MPTYEPLPHFLRDYAKLTDSQIAAWKKARELFVRGLSDRRFDPRLRVKRIRGTADIWELSWAPDGRATFQYGEPVRTNEPHIILRRIGTHGILRAP